MTALRILQIVVGVCVFLSYSACGQQCDQSIKDFESCIRDSFKSSAQGQRQQGQDFKQKRDSCFTSNGCDVPQRPGQGGRAGRVGQGNNNANRQCFENVNAKTKDYVASCVRQTDPSFAFPANGKGEEHGRGGFGGDHHGDGDHGSGGQQGQQQFLLQACKNNQDNANKVQQCLASAFPKRDQQQGANRDQWKQKACAAKTACKAKLVPGCDQVMEKRRQAMCTCGNQAQSQRQTFFQQEPACAGVQQPQQGGRAQHQRDCSKNDDPCQ